jgi:hypothetical protein
LPCVLTVVAALIVLGLTACGGGTSSKVFPDGPTTVGTVSEDVAKSPLIEDVTTLRRAMDNDAAAAVSTMYDIINRAGAIKAPNKGSEMIRKRLPGIVDAYQAAYRAARDKVAAIRPRTNGGRAVRRLDLEVLDDWHRELPRFSADVARTTDSEWAAVIRFGKRTDKMIARYSPQLRTLLSSLPPGQRAALQKALKQTFGG